MCIGNSNPGIFWKWSLSPLLDRQLRFCVFNRSGAAGGVTSYTTFWVTVTPGFTSVSFLGLAHLVLTQVPQWTFMLSLVKNTSSWVLEVWQCTGTMERKDNMEGMCYVLSPQVAYCTRVRQISLEHAWRSPWSTLNDNQIDVLNDWYKQSETKGPNRKISCWRHVGLPGMTTGSVLLPLGPFAWPSDDELLLDTVDGSV